jgi:hypothetical protein
VIAYSLVVVAALVIGVLLGWCGDAAMRHSISKGAKPGQWHNDIAELQWWRRVSPKIKEDMAELQRWRRAGPKIEARLLMDEEHIKGRDEELARLRAEISELRKKLEDDNDADWWKREGGGK